MNGRAISIKWSILAALGCVLATAGNARADCVNDIDCPNPACGGEICDYVGNPAFTCKAAGSQPAGMDGWCSKDSDCKCASMGAKCANSFCTFTKPSDAPSGGGGKSGTGGTTGAAGSGATGTGGTAAAGHTGSTDGGSSGGCNVAGSAAPTSLLALSVLGGLVIAVRRRRRAR